MCVLCDCRANSRDMWSKSRGEASNRSGIKHPWHPFHKTRALGPPSIKTAQCQQAPGMEEQPRSSPCTTTHRHVRLPGPLPRCDLPWCVGVLPLAPSDAAVDRTICVLSKFWLDLKCRKIR